MATKQTTEDFGGGVEPATDAPVAGPVFRHVSPGEQSVTAAATGRNQVARLNTEVAALRRELSVQEARTDRIVERYERMLDGTNEQAGADESDRERGLLGRLVDAIR